MSFQVKTEVPDERVRDLLCSALEGGSNYWYMMVGYSPGAEYLTKNGYPTYLVAPFALGHYVKFTTIGEDEIDGEIEWILDRDAMQRGLDIMQRDYVHHFANFMDENDDAFTGDCFLQCCLFREIIYV